MISMLCLDALALMRALIDHGWTRCCQAKDKYGRSVNPHSSRAASWCVEGARVSAVANLCDDLPGEVREAVSASLNQLLLEATPPAYHVGVYPYQLLNDLSQRKRPVLALIDRAAARLGKS